MFAEDVVVADHQAAELLAAQQQRERGSCEAPVGDYKGICDSSSSSSSAGGASASGSGSSGGGDGGGKCGEPGEPDEGGGGASSLSSLSGILILGAPLLLPLLCDALRRLSW